jgi:hypothetical protein
MNPRDTESFVKQLEASGLEFVQEGEAIFRKAVRIRAIPGISLFKVCIIR